MDTPWKKFQVRLKVSYFLLCIVVKLSTGVPSSNFFHSFLQDMRRDEQLWYWALKILIFLLSSVVKSSICISSSNFFVLIYENLYENLDNLFYFQTKYTPPFRSLQFSGFEAFKLSKSSLSFVDCSITSCLNVLSFISPSTSFPSRFWSWDDFIHLVWYLHCNFLSFNFRLDWFE